MIRLDKFLANAGIGTRREVKKYIAQRRIWVDNMPALKADVKIDIKNNKVTFDKRVVSYEKYKYIMLNKPKGYICATEDENEKTVLDLLPEEYKSFNLFPVGRLDKDTVGLLILSNDGTFAHNMLSPKKHVEKRYFAHINGEVTKEHIKAFEEGIILEDGYKCLKARLEILYSAPNFSKVYITIKEGKYHQIKRMFKALKRKVVYLKRISFYNITLDKNLKEGEYRYLNDKEMELIQNVISIKK